MVPVVLFVYNRADHAAATIRALAENKFADQTDLIIFSDGPKSDKAAEAVAKVRDVIRAATGFKSLTVQEAEKNKGLANSIISGVTQVIEGSGKVIVIEDDLVTSPFFLKYMNEALDYYEAEPRIQAVSGSNPPPALMKFPKSYTHDVYFNYRISSTGWGTWLDRWKTADWAVSDYRQFLQSPERQACFRRAGDDLPDMLQRQMEGKVDSWAIRWCYTQFLQDKLSVYPRHSYVHNIGFDDSGIHSHATRIFDVDVNLALENCRFIPCQAPDRKVMDAFRFIYSRRFSDRVRKKLRHYGLPF